MVFHSSDFEDLWRNGYEGRDGEREKCEERKTEVIKRERDGERGVGR